MPPKKQDFSDIVYDFLSHLLGRLNQGEDVRKAIMEFRDAATLKGKSVTANQFKLTDILLAYNLQDPSSESLDSTWMIETIPDAKGFEMGPHIWPMMESYNKNFDRESESICRTALDLILNECLTVMKADCDVTLLPGSSRTPPPSVQDIKVFGEISFIHVVEPGRSMFSGARVGGQVDVGVGRAIKSSQAAGGKRQFQTLLLLLEAKMAAKLGEGFNQLVVYLASLRHTRLARNRSDASVYGVTSDGYQFQFISITHKGILKSSHLFNINTGKEELQMVLGCLRYLLKKSAGTTPNLTPARESGDPMDLELDWDHTELLE